MRMTQFLCIKNERFMAVLAHQIVQWKMWLSTGCLGKSVSGRLCLLPIPAVLKTALLNIFMYVVDNRYSFCIHIIVKDLGVQKMALIKTILRVWWCAFVLACLRRQGLILMYVVLSYKLTGWTGNLYLYTKTYAISSKGMGLIWWDSFAV